MKTCILGLNCITIPQKWWFDWISINGKWKLCLATANIHHPACMSIVTYIFSDPLLVSGSVWSASAICSLDSISITVCVQLSTLPSYLSLPILPLSLSPIICFSSRVTSSTQLLFGMNTATPQPKQNRRSSFLVLGGGNHHHFEP